MSDLALAVMVTDELLADMAPLSTLWPWVARRMLDSANALLFRESLHPVMVLIERGTAEWDAPVFDDDCDCPYWHIADSAVDPGDV